MPPSFGVIYPFTLKFTSIMIAFLNQRMKQHSNQPLYLVQVAHQISIMPFQVNTINIPLYYSFSSPPAPVLQHLFPSPSPKNTSAPSSSRSQAVHPLWNQELFFFRYPGLAFPQQWLPSPKSPGYDVPLHLLLSAISVLVLITPLFFFFLES